MSERKRAVWTAGLLAAVGFVGLVRPTGTVAAQQGATPPPQRIQVQTVVVKPDMLPTWQDLIRNEAIPAVKKAGVPWRWAWTSGPIGQGFTYVVVTPVESFAQFDKGSPLQQALGADGVARFNAKIRPTIVSSSFTIETLVQDASIQSFSATPPNLIVVSTLFLQPGKGQEWAAITAADFVPVLKKHGVTDYWVYSTTFGAPNTRRTIVTPVANYAALDKGPALTQALGADGAAKLNQKRAALHAGGAETVVLRYVPELSYGIPQRPSR